MNYILPLIIIIVLITCMYTTEKFNDNKITNKKPGVVKQPLNHPVIFQDVQSDDKYHGLFDTTKTISGSNFGGLAAQAM